ncbi:hypothetical protein TTHERM_00156670 (macronuclear) [Tetrahymena thermophila SB210]|uniref:Kinase domain protein n=1 Tax=Tetrahymena thermophila (strain SB210) TaxID=312017 RepID=Q22WG8_TETTS|nr:hypothetical protein TTHERM_00156670 [Tetrahymena thermophila SB210]EAR89449.2 hypothetical protein TTHERM_00156670 [Tetrahymena thermophila SB210]|eukprot:XP_001009694.2 hypothetical protein TTHERM_00156670 [Tetrahymena thermophila SB210]
MQMYSLTKEVFGERFASYGIKLLKPPQEEKIQNFIQTFPTILQKSAQQVNQEIFKYGYRIIKFISKCKNGFVFSANKGRVRFAIKARFNRIVTENGETNMVEKNRELPDNLKFYNNPFILSYIESFETNDFHYTVTEECRCNLSDFIKQVNIKQSSGVHYCFDRYAYQLFSALTYLSIGPEHPNSTRFVSHIRPEDVLISYNSDFKLNPNFGETKVNLGVVPFCNSFYSVNQKVVSCVDRFSISYAHLLLYMNGMSEKDILINWYDLQESEEQSNNNIDSLSQSIISDRQTSYDNLIDVFQPSADLTYRGLPKTQKYKLDNIQQQLYTENEGETVFALGKGKCITIQQYTQIYEYCQIQISQEREDEIDNELSEEVLRIEKKRKRIRYLYDILEVKKRRSSKQMHRQLIKLGRNLIKYIKAFNSLKSKLVQKVESKNQESKKEKEEEEDQELKEIAKQIEEEALQKSEKKLNQNTNDPNQLTQEQIEEISANFHKLAIFN